MKIKALFVVGLFMIVGLMLMVPQKAEAADYVTVSVIRLNQAPNGQITFWADEVNGIFKDRRLWVEPDHPMRKEYLAILLTAISIDNNLRLRWNPATFEVDVIGTWPSQ